MTYNYNDKMKHKRRIIMYCKRCGTKLNDEDKFCYNCGESIGSVQKEPTEKREQLVMDKTNNRYPTKALLVECVGFLFWIYLIIANSRADNDYKAELFLEDSGIACFVIGLLIVVVSYFLFKKHNKEHGMYGIGYVGYIISCVAIIVCIFLGVASLLMSCAVLLIRR